MAFEFDLPTLSPLVLLLLILGVIVFLKLFKYIVLVAVLAGIYVAWRLNLIPGVPA